MLGVVEVNLGSPRDPLAADSGGPAIDFAGSWEAVGCLAAPGPLSGRRWSGPEQQLGSGQLAHWEAGAWQWMAAGFRFCFPLSETAATALESTFPSPAVSD